MKTAKQKSRAEGLAEGHAEGLAEGIDDALIAKMTGLSIDEINRL